MFGRKKKTDTQQSSDKRASSDSNRDGVIIHLNANRDHENESPKQQQETNEILSKLDEEYNRIHSGESKNPETALGLIMQIPRWHYPMQSTHAMDRGTLPHPPVMSIDGRQYMAICTSKDRAFRFAQHCKIYVKQDTQTIGITTTTRDQIIRLAASPRIESVMFDHLVDGGVNTLPGNMPGLYELATGKVIDDIVVTPGPGEFAQLLTRSQVDPADPSLVNTKAIVDRFLRAPNAIVIAERDAEGRQIAKVGTQGDALVFMVFADPYAASAALKETPSEAVKWPLPVFIQWCNRLIEAQDLKAVALLGIGEQVIPVPVRELLAAWQHNPQYSSMQDAYHLHHAKQAEG